MYCYILDIFVLTKKNPTYRDYYVITIIVTLLITVGGDCKF